MKTQFVISFILFLFVSFSASAQKGMKTDTLQVWGNCGMCKEKIEGAAKSAGAAAYSWSPETHKLIVSYKSSKTDARKIQQAVAAVGYDTQDFTAPDDVYNKLHGCCQYERKATTATEKASCCSKDSCSKNMECCKDKSACTGGDCCKDKDCCKGGSCCKKS